MITDLLPNPLAGPGLVGDAWRWTAGSAIGAARWVRWRHTIHHTHHGHVDEIVVPALARDDGVKTIADGSGPLYHRRYEILIRDARLSAAQVVDWLRRDPNEASPTEFAVFAPMEAHADPVLEINTDHKVHLPGPWNGPVRVVAVDEHRFRLATLPRHLEAGEIEFRASDESGDVRLVIESWARAGDPVMRLLHHDLKVGQEVQLHMWAHVLRRAAEHAGATNPPHVGVTTEHSANVRVARPAT